MPACARNVVVREGEIGVYHCWSRCVQRAMLCGQDPVTGTDFGYRRKWIEDLLEYQAGVFAIDVGNYSVLSNHTHLIARTRPDIVTTWSDEEVAMRWKLAWPSLVDGQWQRQVSEQDIEKLLAESERIPQIRANLGSLSWFMARWKETIAKLCNAEMDVSGHFWAERFGARELLDEAAVLACNVYVDLNQMRAGMTKLLEDSRHSAIRNRILAAKAREVAASLEEFDANEDTDSSPLPLDTATAMFADCWLSPICEDGPLMTATLVDSLPASAPKTEGDGPETLTALRLTGDQSNDSVDGNDQSNDSAIDRESRAGTESTDQSPASDTSGDRAATAANHGRLAAIVRPPRASDNPILPMPFSQYLSVVEAVADHGMRAASGSTDQQPSTGTCSGAMEIMESRGLNPTAWMACYDQLETICRRALGTAPRVAERAESVAQQWFHGIAYCRRVFLDEHT